MTQENKNPFDTTDLEIEFSNKMIEFSDTGKVIPRVDRIHYLSAELKERQRLRKEVEKMFERLRLSIVQRDLEKSELIGKEDVFQIIDIEKKRLGLGDDVK